MNEESQKRNEPLFDGLILQIEQQAHRIAKLEKALGVAVDYIEGQMKCWSDDCNCRNHTYAKHILETIAKVKGEK